MAIVLVFFFFMLMVGGSFFIAILYNLIAGFWKKDRNLLLNAGKYLLWFIGISGALIFILITITRYFDLESDQ
jgi:hypothetical protein